MCCTPPLYYTAMYWSTKMAVPFTGACFLLCVSVCVCVYALYIFYAVSCSCVFSLISPWYENCRTLDRRDGRHSGDPQAKNLELRGFHAVRFSIWPGGIPRPTGHSPDIQAQGFLVCGLLACGLAVREAGVRESPGVAALRHSALRKRASSKRRYGCLSLSLSLSPIFTWTVTKRLAPELERIRRAHST